VLTLLRDHAYGVYKLALDCARQRRAPIDDIMTPLADTLGAMVSSGQLRYDREHNQIALA